MEHTSCPKCSKILKPITVKKEGPNKDRTFFSCKDDKIFLWNDSKGYDEDKFKNGACFRCGRYNCDATDCEQVFDWYGNLIPSNWNES